MNTLIHSALLNASPAPTLNAAEIFQQGMKDSVPIIWEGLAPIIPMFIIAIVAIGAIKIGFNKLEKYIDGKRKRR